MRLENLIREIDQEMYKKIVENRSVKDTDAEKTAEIVGLSAIKYGDLSNQASKDYVFDIERFTSFEEIRDRISCIPSSGSNPSWSGSARRAEPWKSDGSFLPSVTAKSPLMLETARFNGMVENAFEEKAPHKICSYIYELSNDFNRFYHETKILTEENQEQKLSWLILLDLVRKVLEQSIDLLAFQRRSGCNRTGERV